MTETLSDAAVAVFESIPRNEWVATGELTGTVSVSRRTVRRYLRDFEERGLIARRRTDEGHADPVRRTANKSAVRSKTDARRTEPASFSMVGGYEYAVCTLNEADSVPIHRLVAVAEYGTDAVGEKQIHHKNAIPWDNRPSNLEPLEHGAHARLHSLEGILSEVPPPTLATLLEEAGYPEAAAQIE